MSFADNTLFIISIVHALALKKKLERYERMVFHTKVCCKNKIS